MDEEDKRRNSLMERMKQLQKEHNKQRYERNNREIQERTWI